MILTILDDLQILKKEDFHIFYNISNQEKKENLPLLNLIQHNQKNGYFIQ